MKIVVLDGFAVNPGDLSWDFLGKFGEYTVYDKTPENECIEKCLDAEVIFTNRVHISSELLNACPKVKYISSLGTGYDMIDLDACRKKGVQVVNVPAYSTLSVAQHTVHLLLTLCTDIIGMSNIVREGKWTGIPGYRYQDVRYTEAASLRLGLVGCGNIGRKVAEIASALGMKVCACAKHKHESNEIIEFTDLYTVLAESDVISFHCPLDSETRGMVNSEMISNMKDGVKLINTSRGAIFNEADVADALNSGKISAAALDVLAVEPADSSNPLLKAKNCFITPHIAWASREARLRMIDVITDSLNEYVTKGTGKNRII